LPIIPGCKWFPAHWRLALVARLSLRHINYFFAFFYTAVVFNPSDVAENMKKAGGYIPEFGRAKKR